LYTRIEATFVAGFRRTAFSCIHQALSATKFTKILYQHFLDAESYELLVINAPQHNSEPEMISEAEIVSEPTQDDMLKGRLKQKQTKDPSL